jgi:hypothetical protein
MQDKHLIVPRLILGNPRRNNLPYSGVSIILQSFFLFSFDSAID